MIFMSRDWEVCEVMEKKGCSLLLFDWDNTLVDTWGLVHESLRVALRGLGMREWDLEETKRRLGASLRDNFPRMFGERALEAKALYRGHFLSRHLEALRPFSEAEALLRWLQPDLHREQCVVSNCEQRTGWGRFACGDSAFGVGGVFSSVVGAEDLVRDKPDRLTPSYTHPRGVRGRGADDFDAMPVCGRFGGGHGICAALWDGGHFVGGRG